ncbi:MAG: HAMP domain-containing histidine kinase [Selenomonadaceae bacterium]|nr:HAMP domain-containing histidine kinase [Selenomonadaceae bacterium]
MKHRLTRRLLLYFTGVLLVFSFVIGISFGYLFWNYAESYHQKELEQLALTMAEGMRDRAETNLMMSGQASSPGNVEAPAPGRRHHHRRMYQRERSPISQPQERSGAAPDTAECSMGTRHAMHCCPTCVSGAGSSRGGDAAASDVGRYLKELNDLSHGEVWVLDAHTQDFSLYGEADTVTYSEFPPAAEEMLQRVLQGETVTGKDFTPLLSAPSITVGTPIYAKDGTLKGALLLHRTLGSLQETRQKALLVFGFCLVIALATASLLSLLLAHRFLRPVQHMEEFAKELAAGNYHLQSGIRQEDEIGSLAKSLDALACRLEDAKEQKDRLDKMRQDFLANISHELRTPITVLRGTLELLSSGLVKDEKKRQEYFSQMTSNVIGLQRLVRDLFELSRLQNTDFELETAELNLTDALQDAVQAARQMGASKGIEVMFPTPSEPILLCGDYGRLRQMFLTILDNAIKFSPNGAAIHVTLRTEADHWHISIRDHGCGIPTEELPHIFERFHSKREPRNKDGTGLGLPIAHAIAHRHGLSIRCESTVGEGTCFDIANS